MSARFGMTCGCTRTTSVECPALNAGVLDAEVFAGWGYDERGFVRCPECLATGVLANRPLPAPQRDLFREAA